MLHEILLSLSGHESPLLQRISKDEATPEDRKFFPEISPPERALLAELTHLSQLHVQLKRHTEKIASSHPSTICRAVASAIASRHLGQFMQKVVDVEKSILSKDAGYVGGYGIVPLSTVVGEFAPWRRRLEWLWQVARFMLPVLDQTRSSRAKSSSGPATIDFLRKESHTGYEDLEIVANDLVAAAEMGWLRQLSSWVLYGQLPTFGAQDFFIQQENKSAVRPSSFAEVSIVSDLVPNFVTPATSKSLLFIGRSLNQIFSHSTPSIAPSANSDQINALMPTHLKLLKSLKSPFASSSFSHIVASIRLSISQNALSQLLPLPNAVQVLDMLHEFVLLGRGEFAMALISNADKRMQAHHRDVLPLKPVRKASRLDDIIVKEAEAAAVLNQTWADLGSLQDDEEAIDEVMEQARALLRLNIEKEVTSSSQTSKIYPYRSQLLPNPTSLSLTIDLDSSLNLFLSPADTLAYSIMNAYLISLRRANVHLSAIWKLTSLRRCHPSPLGPPTNCLKAGENTLSIRRNRESQRGLIMRPYWATAAKVLFMLSTLGNYLHGEVISQHWQHFRQWLDSFQPKEESPSTQASRPTTSASTGPLKPFTTSLSSKHSRPASLDPSTLAAAHQRYLHTLTSALFLTNTPFTTATQSLLTQIDHFIALLGRLQSAQSGLDLQEDEGVVDSLANYKHDEKETLEEMRRAREGLEEGIKTLVDRLGEVAEQMGNEGSGNVEVKAMVGEMDELDLGSGESFFVPWSGRTVDRLVMKLEFLSGEASRGHEVEREDFDD